MQETHKARVVVGMSGGADSSAAALLLKNEGYDVVGITLKLWEYPEGAGPGRCCTPDDIRDARKVAFVLGIPFFVRDYSEAFSREVVDYFTGEYLKGRTPNPCVVCNEKIKFHFLDYLATAIEADFMTTGHYARTRRDADTGFIELLRGKDQTRDQSYFLFRLNQKQLCRLLFPLGEMEKKEVRNLLAEANIPVAKKAESREVCFVTEDNYRQFVEERSAQRPSEGPILLHAGGGASHEVGRHRGVHHFTVGQRKGIGLSFSEPLYVTSIEAEKNAVHVGPRSVALKDGCQVNRVTWIHPKQKPLDRVQVQLRYRGRPIPATLEQTDDQTFQARFVESQEIPTPGQAAVFYDGDLVLGGGWIE